MRTIQTTTRLLIREMDENDWHDVYAMNASPDVMRLIAAGQTRSMKEERAAFEKILANYQKNNGLGIWAVILRQTETFIGAASMTIPSAMTGAAADTGTAAATEHPDIHLGYRFKKEHWGQGYATEVASALVKYGFERLSLDRIAATVNLNNDASRRVLEKVGFRLERSGIFYDWEMNYMAIQPPGESISV